MLEKVVDVACFSKLIGWIAHLLDDASYFAGDFLRKPATFDNPVLGLVSG